MQTIKKNVNDLKFHPMNEQIYGVNEDVSDLKEEIRKSGDVMPLIITPDDVIISGHRRVKACRELVSEGDERFIELDCDVKEFQSEAEEVSYLIRCNQGREKTREQKARESVKLLETEKMLAAARRKATQNNNTAKNTQPEPDVSTLTPLSENNKRGKSRDIAAEEVGFKSGMELERSIFAVNKIDELTAQGRTDDVQLIRNELNNGSASAAEKLAKAIDDLSNEDKQNIRDKKVSVNKTVSKNESKDKKSKINPTVTATADIAVDKTIDKTEEVTKTEDNSDVLELSIPQKVDKYFEEPLEGSLDVEAKLYADPRSLDKFVETVEYISGWTYYTTVFNKDNLIVFANKAVEKARNIRASNVRDTHGEKTKEYNAIRLLLDRMKMFIKIADPIIQAYINETVQEDNERMELKAKRDAEGKRKKEEYNEQVRKDMMAKSRQQSIDMRERERKREMAKQESTEEDWLRF